MKKKAKSNVFTEALGEEIKSRKIFDKAKKIPEDEIFIAEVQPEIVAEQKTKLNKKSKPKQINAPLEEIPKPIIITADDYFEKRVFAEAENDFFEEKQPQIGKTFRSEVKQTEPARKIYYSKSIEQKYFQLDEEKKSAFEFEQQKLSRMEMTGLLISIGLMIYAFINLDKPLFYLTASLLVHLIRLPIGRLFGKYNRAVQNGLRSFSLVLAIGAVLFLFMDF